MTKGLDVSLWTLSLHSGERKPFTLVAASAPDYAAGARFSPDGRWIAYGSANGGTTTIYVEPFPATGQRQQLPRKGSDGPHEAVWSFDGKELFYNPRAGGFEAVTITTKPAFAFGQSRPIPRKFQMVVPGGRTSYDIAGDDLLVGVVTAGQKAFNPGSDDRIGVILNWFTELKSKMIRP